MNRLIQWFIENKVAANLLMVLIFVGCAFSFGHLNKEVFPVVARNMIQVEMSYPGAGPAEVEQPASEVAAESAAAEAAQPAADGGSDAAEADTEEATEGA